VKDSRVKAAHEKQERSWATNTMGMHIGIDDAEAEESFNSKDNLKRRQKQHLSSDVSQSWASSILLMFKALKFWQHVPTVYTSKTPRQDFPLLAIHMTILQIFSLAYPVRELMCLSQTTSTVFVVKLCTTTLRLDQPMQLYDPARGDFDDVDFPMEFGVPQATVNASSPLKEGDVLLEQGVADTRALLAHAMEERFLHNYASRGLTSGRGGVYSAPIPHKYKCMNVLPRASCSFSLAFSLVYILFVACAPSLALNMSPKKILRYTRSFCDEKY